MLLVHVCLLPRLLRHLRQLAVVCVPAQMTAGPKGRVLAAPRRPVIGSAGTLHQRSHFNETDQVLASLRRKQKAFNPLISEN